MTGRIVKFFQTHVPKPERAKPGYADGKTIANFERVVEQTGILDPIDRAKRLIDSHINNLEELAKPIGNTPDIELK
jgi:hypothetical protein